MKKFLITLLGGWAGVHKFIEKKIGLGTLYFFTFGLFGIGWLIDIIKAYLCMNQKKQTVEQPLSNVICKPTYDHIEDDDDQENTNRINFNVAGVTFNNDDGTSRQELLRALYEKKGYSKRDILLQKYEYDGKDAVHVIARGNIIGNVPKECVKTIIEHLDTIRIYHFRVKMNSKGIYYSIIDLFLK